VGRVCHCDYLGLCLCAGAGGLVDVDHPLADQAEKAGSIQVAVIQLANTCGAAIGGVALDHLGLTSPLVISGTLMLLTALLVAGKVKHVD
jgi:DHA1 family purine ribonucleoside efflux pump-like MFS transporter